MGRVGSRPPRPVLLLSFRGSVPQPPIPSPLSPVRATPPCALLSTPLSFTWPRLSETQGSFRDLRCQVLFSASLLVLAMKAIGKGNLTNEHIGIIKKLIEAINIKYRTDPVNPVFKAMQRLHTASIELSPISLA